MKRETEYTAHAHLRAASKRTPRARMCYRYARPPQFAVSWRDILLGVVVLAPIVLLLAIGLLMR